MALPATFRAMRARRLLAFTLLVAAASSALAGPNDVKFVNAPVTLQDPLSKGSTEFSIDGGSFFSPIDVHRPVFNYAGSDIRYGVVLSPILFDSSFMRGDFETVIDGFADGVTDGFGNYLTGGSLLFRYNWFHPGSRFIPYFQLGGGGLHSDAAEVPSQRLIGGNFEFLLQADIGARLLLNDHWYLLMEGGYQHISNADTAARNVGVNALGGRVGVGFIY